ncbi:ShlB/FhaC/HecB family hemolysin secretion/activation protein [Gluconacetobacter dulcium]|uniref:ShlB/FhaC/HecB family hemolysin secretion/activation protein n=1 Tax=Gluconacetobacter dulcium TaxID=2729096 RepID=UPI001C7F2A0F|nr:ShlB/FhaC/HecB family hemolysin secretion/activation protein [Gluconacetobacter dulcium]
MMRRNVVVTASAIAMIVGWSANVYAQAYNRVAPHAADVSAPVLANGPGVTPNLLPDTEQVGTKRLLGISIVPPGLDGWQGGGDGVFVSRELDDTLRGTSFQAAMRARIGRPLTMADINAVVDTIYKEYRRAGRPFMFVSIPPQKVSGGHLQIVVDEYRVGKVSVSGNRWFRTADLLNVGGLESGQRLTLGREQEALDRLNGNPFRSAVAVTAAGAERGLSDVTLKVSDHMPLRGYAGFDTGGTPILGRQEWFLGGSVGRLPLDGTLSYQFTHAVSEWYSAHALNYSMTLPWHDRIQVFGDYAWERPQISMSSALGPIRMTENGHSGQASIRYLHDFRPLFLGDVLIRQQLSGGFDYKTTNNAIEFGGVNVYAGSAEVAQFPVSYLLSETDKWGQTTFRNTLTFSPGGLTGGNSKRAMQTIVPGASAGYVYDTMSLSRLTYLPLGMSWSLDAVGQVSSGNLMYSNQIGLGGLYTTRGYFTSSAYGSEGVTVQNELHSPAWSVWKGWDTEQVGAFVDYGHVSQVKRIPQGVNSLDLASVGLDAKMKVRDYLDVTFNVGWRLAGMPAERRGEGYGDRGAFGNVAVTVGF